MKLINYAECQKLIVDELDKLPTYIDSMYCQHNASMRGGLHKALKCLEKCQSYVPMTEYKYSKWLINSDGYYPYCSLCKGEPQNGVMTKYCPNCGAKMVVTNTQ